MVLGGPVLAIPTVESGGEPLPCPPGAVVVQAPIYVGDTVVGNGRLTRRGKSFRGCDRGSYHCMS